MTTTTTPPATAARPSAVPDRASPAPAAPRRPLDGPGAATAGAADADAVAARIAPVTGPGRPPLVSAEAAPITPLTGPGRPPLDSTAAAPLAAAVVAAAAPPAQGRSPGRAGGWLLGLLAALLVAAQGLLAWSAWHREDATARLGPLAVGTLCSVTLANGQVYYGDFVGADAGHLRLGDVYYVQTAVDPASHQPVNRLVSRRRADWHAPAWMSVPLDKVLLLEAVGSDSRLGRLVAQDRQAAAAAPSGTAAEPVR